MARKVETYTVQTAGRDQGKVFVLTEMPARQAERWATRAFLALANSGVDIPEAALSMGAAGLVVIGYNALAGASYDDLEPLMDEMWACVQVMPDPARPAVLRPMNGDGDVEEIQTLIELRREVFRLHVDFSAVAALLKSRVATVPISPTTPTSPA